MAAPPAMGNPAQIEPVGELMHVFMHGHHIADLRSTREGRAQLTYLPGATEVTRGLSCCLPAAGVRFSGLTVTNWLAGLLPDRSEVLRRWRARYRVRRQDAYALLWHVGEDVAGAARFVRPDRASAGNDAGSAVLVTEAEIGRRIQDLAADATGWTPSFGAGQFSLAGAQAKFALALTEQGWAQPSGDVATTHIFKPAIPGMPDQDLNEHLTTRLAAAVGLPVAHTEVIEFTGARALVVSRFDRYRTRAGTWRRVHQEDAVQALGLPPALKYESEGGPGARRLVTLLRDQVSEGYAAADVATLVDALAFNWLVVGTDAHARNYALMHHGQATRLAPLYDLNSFLPYADGRPNQLSMRVGFTESDPARIGGREWEEMARDCRLDVDDTLGRVARMAERIVPAAEQVLTTDEVCALQSLLPRMLHDRLSGHVAARRTRL